MADNTIAYYEDGVPHSADGAVVIVIDGKTPVDTGGTGGGAVVLAVAQVKVPRPFMPQRNGQRLN